jgi:hypothetical protein
MKFVVTVLAATLVASHLAAADLSDIPVKISGLVAFWDFREAAGAVRVSLGTAPLQLREMNGPIEQVADGPFGHAAHLRAGQWFRIPRAELGPLDIHGKDAQVTVIAWIKRERKQPWQTIAGVWDESRGQRQYCLFLNAAKQTDARTMTRVPSHDLFQGHVSAVGGPTPGQPVCITYASSGAEVPFGSWQCLAMTYDGREVRLYRGGNFEAAEGMNPFPYADGLFDGAAEGAEFTVGSVSVGGKPGNFFGGWIGGLAVYRRALPAEEIRQLATATRVEGKP